MTWIGWIVLGALAGMVAKAIMKEEGGFVIYSFIVAVLGAVIVIWVVRLITGKRAQ